MAIHNSPGYDLFLNACEHGIFNHVKAHVEEYGPNAEYSFGVVKAASNGHFEIVQYLVEYGQANVVEEAHNPLRWAAYHEQEEIVLYLIKQGCDIEKLNNDIMERQYHYCINLIETRHDQKIRRQKQDSFRDNMALLKRQGAVPSSRRRGGSRPFDGFKE